MRLSLRFLAALAALWCAAPVAAQDLSCERGDREVRSLRFVGNREYSAAVLASTVATLPSTLPGVPLVGTRRCLDPVEFARDIRRLETLYRRRGYPDVRVDTVVRVVRPAVIDIEFQIAEGEPMRVSAFAIRGIERDEALGTAARDFPL
ncbi:MAG: POTRA domain-containing protein, partial [Gemmatimonas sp.]